MLSMLHSFYRPTFLALCVLLGLAFGHLTGTLLQMKLRPEVTAVTGTEHPVTSSSTKFATADLNLILQKNIFDANNRSTTAAITAGLATQPGQEASVATARTDLKLFGTVVAAERSQVLLEVNKELKLYHLGDKIPGGGTVEEIRRNQVGIRNRDQSLTTLSLYEEEPSSSRDERANAGTRTDAADGVREVDENRWVISRSTIESVRENFADQLRLAQIQPRTVDGKTNGFLVQRINPRSLLAKVGLQRGDVIIDVNNIKMDSPEKGLQVLQQLREARQINLSVERNGQPMTFAYEIE